MTIEETIGGVRELAATCQGAVLVPGDELYAETCQGWNLAWTHQPAVVVRVASESDVVQTVRYAAAHDLAVAVQATGHGVTIPADRQSVLISTTDLDQVHIDAQARTATLGGGAIWEPVLAQAQEHGLAPLLGSAPHVGAVGYSLGGGFGWLARQHGLCVDAIQSLRVVLADGQVITTSPSAEPELFWALCGSAGGTLGVVTEMTVALAPVSEVYAGNLFYPVESAREVFERYLEWSSGAPTELTSAFTLMAFPPFDMVPEPLRGKTFAIVRGCYAGSSGAGLSGVGLSGAGQEAGVSLVDEWRQWRQPLMDTWVTMPFARAGEISMDPVEPIPAAASGRWLARLDSTVLEAMLAAVLGGDGPSPMLLAEARQAGGAISRDNPSVSFAARDGAWLLELVGIVAGPGAGEEVERRIGATWEQVAPNLAGLSSYLNFVEGHERVQTAPQAFSPDIWSRLATAKRHYDPTNVFRHGIPLAESL
ncbi:FAD-binding oxidoreductase [Ornithinimicrobium cryptoxanthini]|uniref:FAD-binding oxidoreductase n=1 Tax=Ornithinimicrobium cryptoxanthini TaxID=2934161 RepID=UPI00211964C5|nr:FAD-binding oxidoreductase [Ornithinimicrobium cryptoxanthini]